METNIIYNKDCIEGMKELPDESIDGIITDPPYGINKSKIIGDEDFWTIGRMLPEAYRVLKKDSFFICFCSIAKIPELLKLSPFNYRWMCIMFTNNSMARGSMGFSAFVPALVFMKGNAKIKKQIRDVCEISTSAQQVKAFYHPYQKHEKFLTDLILTSSREGDIILDPFSGGGSVPVACKELNRQFIGYEIDPQYYKLSLERLSDKTSTSATPTFVSQKEFNISLKESSSEDSQISFFTPEVWSN